jgi:hypothetical protein
MPHAKAKPAASKASPKTETASPESAASSVAPTPYERRQAHEATSVVIQDFFEKAANLDVRDDWPLVIGLVELFNYGKHDGYNLIGNTQNWLGVFVSEVLRTVVELGPKAANGHPEYVQQQFETVMYELADTLRTWDKINALPFAAVEQIEQWGVGHESH